MSFRRVAISVICTAALVLSCVCYADDAVQGNVTNGTGNVDGIQQTIASLIGVWDDSQPAARDIEFMGTSTDMGYEGAQLYTYNDFRFYYSLQTQYLSLSMDKYNEKAKYEEADLLQRTDRTIELFYGGEIAEICERTVKKGYLTKVEYEFDVEDVVFSAAAFSFSSEGRLTGYTIYNPNPSEYEFGTFLSEQESLFRAEEVVKSLLMERYLIDESEVELDEASLEGRKIGSSSVKRVAWYWKLYYNWDGDADYKLGFQVIIDAISGQLINIAYNLSDGVSVGGVTPFVERLYRICLGRNSEQEGLDAWCGVLNDDIAGGKKVAYGFFFSPEFQKLELDDAEYVSRLYHAMLGREGELEGIAAWTKALEDGHSRLKVFNGFANSKEFGNLCQEMGVSV